jgi:hypothetical protein
MGQKQSYNLSESEHGQRSDIPKQIGTQAMEKGEARTLSARPSSTANQQPKMVKVKIN